MASKLAADADLFCNLGAGVVCAEGRMYIFTQNQLLPRGLWSVPGPRLGMRLKSPGWATGCFFTQAAAVVQRGAIQISLLFARQI